MRIFYTLFLCFCLIVGGKVYGAGYEYDLSWDNPTNHVYTVSMQVDPSPGAITTFRVPSWRPGRYITQDYASGISHFSAKDNGDSKLEWRKRDKDSWEVRNPQGGKIVVSYQFYANVMDAGSSYLGHAEAYFNPVNFFMYCDERENEKVTLTISSMPDGWKAATSLKKIGKNQFFAKDYHLFIDSPTILSPTIKTIKTRFHDADFFFHFQGNFNGDEDTEVALRDNITKIIRQEIAVFHDLPLDEYHFIFHLLPYDFRHAVEHAYCSSYTLPEDVCNSPESLNEIYEIVAHEVFHLWNVKRLRPEALMPYKYDRKVYTSLHWWTEGVTSYYADLILLRAGLINKEEYLQKISDMISTLENTYANQVVSPADASINSWLDGSEYANPHHHASYYGLGYRIGLLMDMQLRAGDDHGHHESTMDDLFRKLYHDYYKKGNGIPEDGIQHALDEISHHDWSEFFDDYVFGTKPFDYEKFFEPFGLRLDIIDDTEASYTKIGISEMEHVSYGIHVSRVVPRGDAADAGLGDGDIILSINNEAAKNFRLDEIFKWDMIGTELDMKIYRDGHTENHMVRISGESFPKIYTLTLLEDLDQEHHAHQSHWLEEKEHRR